MQKYIDDILNLIAQYPLFKSAIVTVLLILAFVVIRKLIFRAIDKSIISKQDKVKIRRKISRWMFYILIFSIFFLWFAKIQVFFVSLFAIAAAIVVALKELIMCFTGGLLISAGNLFKVGQRIEIDGTRGFVFERGLLVTKILEVGPEKNSQQTTGDIIAIPNGMMLSKAVKNESYFKGYSIKSFVFKISEESQILPFENEILNLGKSISESFLTEAKKSISRFCEKEGLAVPAIDPRTKIIVDDGADFSVLLKMPVKNSEIAATEQTLNRFYLDWRLKNVI